MSKVSKYLVVLLPLLLLSCGDLFKNTDYTENENMIAFTGYADSSSTDLDVFMIEYDTDVPTVYNISGISTEDFYPVWTYEHEYIAYIAASSVQYYIYAADPIEFSADLLISESERIYKLEASPTDPFLAYISLADGDNYELSILDIDSEDAFTIDEIPYAANPLIAWSPDGSMLAAATDEIYIYDTTDSVYLYSIDQDPDYMFWDAASDGLYLVISGNIYWADSSSQEAVFTGYNLAYPAISPDRNYLAAVAQDLGNELIAIDLTLGSYEEVAQIELPTFHANDYRCAGWSSDSRYLAYLDTEEGAWNIYIADEHFYFSSELLNNELSIKNALCWY